MSTPKALVLRNAGINCDAETVRALEGAGATADLLHFNHLVREPGRFDDYQILVIPGGFSHGDDIAAGRIFATEFVHALKGELMHFVERGGIALGICNGFQVLTETGLIDGSIGDRAARKIALTDNESLKYECRWVYLRSEESVCPFLVPGEIWPVPRRARRRPARRPRHGRPRRVARRRPNRVALRQRRRLARRVPRVPERRRRTNRRPVQFERPRARLDAAPRTQPLGSKPSALDPYGPAHPR